MAQINRNSCRVCLGVGFKPIFGGANTNPASGGFPPGQHDRLAEKMRFVSMLPITDSPYLPQMLCYSCIVQLNAAYNFKNVIIDSSMYLDRVAIENGGGNTLTPAITMMDSDQQFCNSSQRPPLVTSPPPASVISCTSVNEQGMIVSSAEQSDSTEYPMLDASQIKQEPSDDDTSTLVLRSAMHQIMADHKKSQRTRGSLLSPTTAASNNSTPTKQRPLSGQSVLLGRHTSPLKKPMVSVHRGISRSSKSDREFLEQVLHRTPDLERAKAARVQMPVATVETVSKKIAERPMETNAGSGSKKYRNGLLYDSINSKVVQEILASPLKRLRQRRRSTRV